MGVGTLASHLIIWHLIARYHRPQKIKSQAALHDQLGIGPLLWPVSWCQWLLQPQVYPQLCQVALGVLFYQMAPVVVRFDTHPQV